MRLVQGESEGARAMTRAMLTFIGRLGLWSLVTLLILDNMGLNVTALVASLGIGGVAVALAAQNILGDLFASLSIALDKPFVLNDFIIVDDLMGTVEHVGLKTTRIRSLSGEQIVLANNDLLKSRIRNYGRMSERRAIFSIGVTYDTPADALEALPGVIRAAIEAQPGVRFDRAHFKGFGVHSLDFEAVYYVLDPGFTTYMDVQQAINLRLVRELHARGIHFALPARMVQLHGGLGTLPSTA
jgi:small-conductance mechanosensitive channel